MNELARQLLIIFRRIRDDLTAIRESHQQQERTAHEERQAAIERPDPTPEMRSILNTLQGIEREQRAGNQSQNQYQNRNLLVQLAGVIVVGLYTTVTAWQACTMSNTLKEIQKQTPAIIASGQGAKDAASDAQAALAQARDQFRQDQRPYVGLATAGWAARTYLVNDGPNKGHMAITLNYANYGKSPAINVRYNGFVAIGNNAPSRVRWHKIPDSVTGIIVPPTETKAVAVAYSEDVVTPDRFAALSKNPLPLIFFGHFEYTDMFGAPKPIYTTEFCMATTPNPVVTQPDFVAVCNEHTNMK